LPEQLFFVFLLGIKAFLWQQQRRVALYRIPKPIEMMFDLAIIGGGPAGFFAAECAGNQGLKVILFEKDTLGGVCINEGCIPAKTLLHSIQAYNIVKDAEKYGIITDKNASFSMELALNQKEKVVKNMQTIVNDKFNNDIATLVQGKAYIKGRSADGCITICCEDQEYCSKNLLICTGSRPDMPEIQGIESPLVCTYDTMLNSTEPQKKLVMIGGGQVSVELAHIYNSLGTEITILEENDEILLDTDNEISSVLRQEYAKRGIITHLNTRISRIEENKVFFSSNGIEMTAEGDRIVCDIGRRPNLEGFGLENLDVECYRKGIRINNQMQTSEPNVFAAGDVTGFSKSAHAAYCEASVAINTILGIDDQMNFKAVPTCVFSSPEIAHVGITEETLNLAWRPHKIIRLPLTQSSRYVINDEKFEGLCKIIVGDDETILGVHIIGNNCSEAIVAAVMAVESQMTISEWSKIVFPYPTIGEVMKGALIYSKIPFEQRKS
jgi:dihydrolipoamide dehydrogenase